MINFLLLTSGKGNTTWTPASLPNLSLWLDMNTLTPGAVTTLTDLSPNAQTFTGTGTAVASSLNGKTGLQLNGTSDFFTGNGTTIVLPQAGPNMFWAVVNCAGFTYNGYPCIASLKVDTTGSGNSNVEYGLSNDASYQDVFWGSGTTGSQPVGHAPLTAASPTGAPHRIAIIYLGGGLNSLGNWSFTDGATTETISNNGGTGSAGSTNIIGAQTTAGAIKFYGTIYEIVATSDNPSSGDLAKLQSYGLAKYGI